jgi:hypothetical protein
VSRSGDDHEGEGEQQSGMTQGDGPLAVAKPGGLGDSAAEIPFQPMECEGHRAVSPGAPHTSASLTSDLAAIVRDKLLRHWDAAVNPADSLESD